MCGLAGCFTSANVTLNKSRRLQRAKIIEGLLIANQTRGTDSTGIAAIGFDGAYDLNKRAVEAWRFVEEDSVKKLTRSSAPIMIGHTRMSSMGYNDVTDENAHPFVEGNIIGAHNGIINNYTQIDKTVNVDSQAVLRLLNEHELAYDYAFSKVRGSCALTWWDARDPDAMFLVAHENPLSVAIIPDIETVYWSSESDHLEVAMRAAYGSKVFHMDVARDTIYRFDSSDPFAWQESPVKFMAWGNTTTVYSHGMDEYSHDKMEDYFGYSGDNGVVRVTDRGPALLTVKDDGVGKVSPPQDLIEETDEEKYDRYWESLAGESYRSRNDDAYDEGGDEKRERSIHSLSDSEYIRTEVEEVGDMECEYCGRPFYDGTGVYDDGLQMMMCNACIRWWDAYGSKTVEGKIPEATA